MFLMILLAAVALTFVFSFLGFFFFGGIYPRDTKIFDTLYGNEEMLLGIDVVKAVGIEYENRRPIGIKVYVEDISNIQEIPNEINGVKVFIKKW